MAVRIAWDYVKFYAYEARLWFSANKESVGLALFSLLILFYHAGTDYWEYHWSSKWFSLVLSFSVAYSLWFGSQTSYWFTPFLGYLLLSSSYMALTPSSLPLQNNCMYSFLTILIGSLFIVWFPRKLVPIGKYCLMYFWAASVLSTWMIGDSSSFYGTYSGNASMNGSLIAALLPFLGRGLLPVSVAVFTICLIGKGVPIAVLAAVGFAYGFKRTRWAILWAALWLVGIALLHPSDSGRWDIWSKTWYYWNSHHNTWLGSGIGSVQILVPEMLKAQNPYDKQSYLWLHNEFLQLWAEGGWLGLGLFFMAYFKLIKMSFKTPYLFASVAGWSVVALLNYPCRLAIHYFCMLIILSLILREKEPRCPKV